jgi:hypothetical protein
VQGADLLARQPGAGRVGGVGDEHQARALIDALDHLVDVDALVGSLAMRTSAWQARAPMA